jgi:hypothetical protein
MPAFRIHRLKDHERQRFRWAPHTSGATLVKPRDYVPDGEIEAASAYAAWAALRASEEPLEVGDLLEVPGEGLRIFKYVGFEDARWVLPEVRNDLEPAPAGAGVPAQ